MTLLDSDILIDVLRGHGPAVAWFSFGFDDGAELSYEEVGRMFGLSFHRIRQIQAKALRKLRHPSRASLLRVFLER